MTDPDFRRRLLAIGTTRKRERCVATVELKGEDNTNESLLLRCRLGVHEVHYVHRWWMKDEGVIVEWPNPTPLAVR